MNVPGATLFDNDRKMWRLARRVSLREAFGWFLGISIALAVPIGLGLPLLPMVFYGTFGVLTWRLSQAMPLNCAVLLAATAALGLSVACVCVL